MTYGIQNKTDSLTGASLIVNVPECELDRKALYTIQAEKPGFILPFRYRNIDGQIEFIYQIGSNCKLQYLPGSRTTTEYAELWSDLLSPLLGCGDWFMKPYSFVLSPDYIYCDKKKGSISYIYIPSVRDCSGYETLKQMAAEVSKLIRIADVNLENMVLRAIMQDFKPGEFLQMLKTYTTANAPAALRQPMQEQNKAAGESGSRTEPARAPEFKECVKGDDSDYTCERIKNIPGDIIINIPVKNGSKKKRADSRSEETNKDSYEEKEAEKLKKANSFFSRNKETRQISPTANASMSQQAQFQESALSPSPPPVYAYPVDETDCTQSLQLGAGVTGLRLAGNVPLPPFINVSIAISEVFTIGRFDATAGRRPSDFEFEKNTKAVSRRHAVIERGPDGYNIIDISSSAGTYVNGQMLPPNTPYLLGRGCRVSFGNAGADYIWEE